LFYEGNRKLVDNANGKLPKNEENIHENARFSNTVFM